jgi:hypothetical protein
VLLGRCEPVAGPHGGIFLFLIVKENNGTVLRSGKVSLPAGLCRIMQVPENVEKVVVGDTCRIKNNANRFRMAGGTGFNLLVAGILKQTTGIACNRLKNAINLPERRLNIPEASCGKACSLTPASLLHLLSG